MSTQRLNIIGIFALASVAALALSLPWELPRENIQSAKSAVAGGAGTLEVRGGIETNRLVCATFGPCPRLNFWYVFHNRSAQPILGFRIVALRAPGFLYDANDHGLAQLLAVPAAVASQASVGAEASLRPQFGSGRYNVELVYAWTNAAGGELRGTLALGPVEVSPWWHASLYNSARRVKDLGLPLMLAVFGWWLQREQKKRDDLQVVLTTLLPTHVQDSKRFYLPIATRAHRLIERLESVGVRRKVLEVAMPDDMSKAEQKLNREELRCVLALFELLHRHRFLIQEIGGVQFSGHDGEKIVQSALRILLTEATEYRIEQDVQDRMLKLTASVQSFDDFLALLGTKESMVAAKDATEAALTWIRDPAEPLAKMRPLLVILREVLLFEMDRPMALWYRKPRLLPVDVIAKAASDLEPLVKRDPADTITRIPEIDSKIRGYIDDLRMRLTTYGEGKASAKVPAPAAKHEVAQTGHVPP